MPISPPGAIQTTPHEVHRLAIAVGQSFDGFRHRYERAVPRLDADRFARLQREGADWEEVLRAAAENAPHDFMIFWSLDVTEMMALAGDTLRCVQYLMGNHTIAERMYRYDPAVMLYAPLRTEIYEDAEGATWFSVDQPSTCFASFGTPAITQVGIELDRELAGLLTFLDVPVPPALTAGMVPSR
jgi:hypothetical protein